MLALCPLATKSPGQPGPGANLPRTRSSSKRSLRLILKYAPCSPVSLFMSPTRSCSCCATARKSRKITGSGLFFPRVPIWTTRPSVEISLHSVSSGCSVAKSSTGGSFQPTAPHSSSRHCTLVNFSSGMTRDSVVSRSPGKAALPGFGATDLDLPHNGNNVTGSISTPLSFPQ